MGEFYISTTSQQLIELKNTQDRLDLCLSAGNLAWWEMNLQTGKVIFNEQKVQMLGYKMKDFQDATYTAFTGLLHPDDYDKAMQAMQDHIDGKRALYEVEYRIRASDGTYKWFYDRGSIVERDPHNKPLIVKGVVFDITSQKKAEQAQQDLLESLDEQVKKRTAELKHTKDYLSYIINSATELIISFDMNNRVSTWNTTAEQITGYTEKDVLNRSVNKLDVFEHPETIIDYIKKVCQRKQPKKTNIILRAKGNEKRIIQISAVELIGNQKECLGTLFVGTDITRDIEMHGKLLEGNSYLIRKKNLQHSIDLFVDITRTHHQGLLITRSPPQLIHAMVLPKDISIALLRDENVEDYPILADLNQLIKVIDEFCQTHSKPIILLDGLHYLITRFNFEQFIKTLFTITDIIANYQALLFVRLDPSIVNNQQDAVIENELQLLPSQKVDDVIIEDDTYHILQFIAQQNERNAIVSIKKIMNHFKIAYATVISRLEDLEQKELVFTKKQGKLRTTYLTDKGRTLLRRRKTA